MRFPFKPDFFVPASLTSRRRVHYLKGSVFLLTFLSYAIYTALRLPASVSKSTLAPNDDQKSADNPGWAPFNGNDGSFYLGALDTTFLLAYAFGLVFVGGPLGDRVNLRWFLGFGMICVGISGGLFGLGYFWNIHNIFYFAFCNILAGVSQSTGWPGNVTLMTRWWGKGSRGTIMGIWNAHGSLGSILGKLVATNSLDAYGWAYAFLVPAILSVFIGILLLIFLIPHPADVLSIEDLGLLKKEADGTAATATSSENTESDSIENSNKNQAADNRLSDSPNASDKLLNGDESSQLIRNAPPFAEENTFQSEEPPQRQQHIHSRNTFTAVPSPSAITQEEDNDFDSGVTVAAHAVSPDHSEHPDVPFLTAVFIPGVLPYSMCLFFSKFVAYAFIFWLPYYLTQVGYDDSEAGNLSTVYDAGGVLGGIVAGFASDRLGKRGFVSVLMLVISVPFLEIYNVVAAKSMGLNILVMFIVGIFVNGPYTLVSSAVAADLGQHPSLKGNPKAMSTVTGFIDGTGTLGAAAQGLLIGWMGGQFGWDSVLYLLMIMSFLSALCISRAVYYEFYPVSVAHSHVSHLQSENSGDLAVLAADKSDSPRYSQLHVTEKPRDRDS